MMPDLGKYAFAVLSSYGVTILLLGGLIGLTIQRGLKVRKRLEEIEQRQERG